jgi:hypothetical protein
MVHTFFRFGQVEGMLWYVLEDVRLAVPAYLQNRTVSSSNNPENLGVLIHGIDRNSLYFVVTMRHYAGVLVNASDEMNRI